MLPETVGDLSLTKHLVRYSEGRLTSFGLDMDRFFEYLK